MRRKPYPYIVKETKFKRLLWTKCQRCKDEIKGEKNVVLSNVLLFWK